MSTDTQPAPEIVVTADEWIMTARPSHEQREAFESWLDAQTGQHEIAAWIDSFAIDGPDLWCHWMYETLPSDWVSRWKRWPITVSLPIEPGALIHALLRQHTGGAE